MMCGGAKIKKKFAGGFLQTELTPFNPEPSYWRSKKEATREVGEKKKLTDVQSGDSSIIAVTLHVVTQSGYKKLQNGVCSYLQ